MEKISVYFRDEEEGWEYKNMSFDPQVYNSGQRSQLIHIGCNFSLFGTSAIAHDIDRFLDDNEIKEYGFDATGAGRYYYIMRREEV